MRKTMLITLISFTIGIECHKEWQIIWSSPKIMDIQPKIPEINERNLKMELAKAGIKHRKIVLAQAKLETGNFKSNVCREYNNLFGLYDSSTGDYYRFDDWRESVKAYKTCVQYRYKGEGYYRFLKRIGYAKDRQYIKKIKQITKQ